jgi:nondiscriminating aspartyl-tRNA synthetase
VRRKSMDVIKGTAPPPTDLKSIREAGEGAIVRGSIYNIRDIGEIAFIIVRTPDGLVQCVHSPDFSNFEVSGLREGDCVIVSGTAVDEPRAENGFELRAKEIKVLSSPVEEYPFSINKKYLKLNLDTNLNFRPLTLRNLRQRAIFKVQEGIVAAFEEFMRSQGFTRIHSPKIVKAGAEGGANIFAVDYFGEKAYLNQSPQFYKQTMVGVFERVYEVAPVYRAEKHSTSRHLNEYIGLDFEMGFINGMRDVMETETALLRHVVKYLGGNYAKELKLLGSRLPEIKEIPAITFLEARDIITTAGKEAGKWDLEPEDEQLLCDWATEKADSELVFITHFPSAKRPFYAMDDPDDSTFALSFDLLLRGLEVTTGGQRIHDYNMQVGKMKAMGLDPEDFKPFLMIHKYGMPPHGGLGIGLERLTMKLLGLGNVREASLFPRDINRLEP